MVSPVSLANMEYALYGNTEGLGSTTAPSMMNNYCASSSYLNSYPGLASAYNTPYSMYTDPYAGMYANPASLYAQQQGTTQQASQSDVDKVANFYNKSSQVEETLIGAVVGNAVFGLINNPRLIAHPYNSIKSLGKVKEMFKGVKVEGSNAYKLWNNPETNELMREAYGTMHKIEARNMKKLGLFRQSYTQNPKDYEALKPYIEKLKSAINSGDAKGVEDAVAHLKAGYTNNGPISKGLGAIKRFFGGTTIPNTAAEALKNATVLKETQAEIASKVGKTTFKNALKRGGGVKGGLFFMGIELLMGIPNIKEAFSKDKKTGWKQVGQTTVKGAGSAIGWAVGDALVTWRAAKICAAAGTAIAPGVGTAIGAVIGLIGGGIGCWLVGKGTKALVGQDVGEKVKLEKMKQTPEGQVQLLQLTASQKNIPLDVQQAMMNMASQYGMVA